MTHSHHMVQQLDQVRQSRRIWRWAALGTVGGLLLLSFSANAELDDMASAEFEPNEPIVAQEFNDRFNELYAAVNELEERGPRLCGVSNSPRNGALGGYVGGSAICRNPAFTQGCGENARICTAYELTRLAAEGTPIPEGWFSTGIAVTHNDAVVNDCRGWVSGTALDRGVAWIGDNRPETYLCSVEFSVLCCE